jgi:exonuclease III
MRIASFNLENLFTRPAAMNMATDAAGRKAIEDHASANAIIAKEAYSAADKTKLITLSNKYGWHLLNPPKSALVYLNKIRGHLFRKPKTGPLEVVAKGREDWTGWFDLRRDDVSWQATFNTGRVIDAVNPDVLLTIEVENRPTLGRFNDQVLGAKFSMAYRHLMVVDGNDTRGIDVGIMSKYPIEAVRSHVDEPFESKNKVFSRDCPEYDVLLPSGERLVVLPNHFKSKRNGDDQESQDRREAQAKLAHVIAKKALVRSDYVLIGGDLNDTPTSTPLAALFDDGFKDIQSHADYPADRPGTYGTGLKTGKIDYLICSPKLWSKVKTCGIERRGSYHPGVWTPFDSVKKEADEASDHQCIWMDVGF